MYGLSDFPLSVSHLSTSSDAQKYLLIVNYTNKKYLVLLSLFINRFPSDHMPSSLRFSLFYTVLPLTTYRFRYQYHTQQQYAFRTLYSAATATRTATENVRI